MLIFNVQSVNLVKSFGSVAASNTRIEGFVKYIDMHWIPVALIVVSFVAEVKLEFFSRIIFDSATGGLSSQWLIQDGPHTSNIRQSEVHTSHISTNSRMVQAAISVENKVDFVSSSISLFILCSLICQQCLKCFTLYSSLPVEKFLILVDIHPARLSVVYFTPGSSSLISTPSMV